MRRMHSSMPDDRHPSPPERRLLGVSKRKRETVEKPMTADGFSARIGSEFPRSGATWTAMNAAEAMRWKTNAR
jgi:hypothetical protein